MLDLGKQGYLDFSLRASDHRRCVHVRSHCDGGAARKPRPFVTLGPGSQKLCFSPPPFRVVEASAASSTPVGIEPFVNGLSGGRWADLASSWHWLQPKSWLRPRRNSVMGAGMKVLGHNPEF